MAITSIVDKGQIIDAGKTSEKEAADKKNAVDEDMFLKLLVAEMKYQDPMKPTSNTEWVSQYATFTQVEQTSAMQGSLKQMEAGGLVGKEVIMRTTNEATGETNFFSGPVDYMYVESGKIYLSVKDQLYSIDDLDTIVDEKYMDSLTVIQTFEKMMEKLPKVNALTVADEPLITATRKAYDSMTDYQKNRVKAEFVDTLKSLEKKLSELKGDADTKPDVKPDPEKPGDTDTNGTGKV
ncbi:MAG: flagellar hook capping FlgD N-terminal domain-containing protein [Lachnospiraceae bacterium]